jgi:hypothetical protein
MNGVNLSSKFLLGIIITIVILTSLSIGTILGLIYFAKEGSDWFAALIGSLGNVIGGIIGAIVAVIVATIQINRTFKNEKDKQLQTTTTMLKLINEELKDNISSLEESLPIDTASSKLLKLHISDDTWKSTMVHLFVSDTLLVKLNVCYRKVSLIKSLDDGEIDEHIVRELIGQINQTIESVKVEIRPNIDN